MTADSFYISPRGWWRPLEAGEAIEGVYQGVQEREEGSGSFTAMRRALVLLTDEGNEVLLNANSRQVGSFTRGLEAGIRLRVEVDRMAYRIEPDGGRGYLQPVFRFEIEGEGNDNTA